MAEKNMNTDEMDESIVILTDDEGNDIEFEFLDLIEYEGKEYVVLLPSDPEDVEEGVLILEVVRGTEETYLDIDDDELLEKLFDIFRERYNGDYEFEDAEDAEE